MAKVSFPLKAFVDEGVIEVFASDKYTVTAPNNQKFRGKCIESSRMELYTWWSNNGGGNSKAKFSSALSEIIRLMKPCPDADKTAVGSKKGKKGTKYDALPVRSAFIVNGRR